MNIGKLVWATVSAALAFGVNHQMRPRLEASFERAEPGEAARGALTLVDSGLQVETTGVHVVIEDQVHVGKQYQLREISLRSIRAQGAAPSLELFIAMPPGLHATPGTRIDPSALLQLELPIRATGRLGSRESFVQRDATGVGRVLAGSWQFTDIHENWDSGSAELVAEARVELQVETARGVHLLTGKWTGRLFL